MSGTLPLSTATQETTLETVSDALTIDPGSEDFKSSPNASAPLSNGIEAGKTKLAIRKPPPPVQAKPSRFLKKSLTLSSLPRLGNKSSNSRLKESKEENGEENSTAVVFLPTNMQESKGKRESSIWKIPTLKKNRRHSAIHTDEVSSITIVEPRLATTPPETHKNILTSTTAPPRELPPLPTIPPLGVPLPTEGQNETQIETDQNLASHNAAEVQSMATNADVGDVNTSSISGDDARAQSDSSFSHSIESLPQAASVPQSTSTPKSAHSFTPNSQFEKADASDTIQSLIEKYSKCVPLRIRVLQGYCSDTADINISTGDLYDVQVMKTTKVVTIRDQDGMTYRVPLESMMKFGLVFNLSSNYDEGLCGYTFRTVSDLTSLSILPRVVCTVRALKGNDARSSVQENEILVVQQAIKSMFRGKRGIKVYSVTANIEKVLPEDCDVGFSTNPSLVRLQLSDIINHISYPFPAHAVMYPSAENVDEDIPGKCQAVVTPAYCMILMLLL